MRRAAALSIVLLCACGGGGVKHDPDAAPPGTPDAAAGAPDAAPPTTVAFEIGTTDGNGAGFVKVNPGDDVDLSLGLQGGYHIWTKFQLRGVSGAVAIDLDGHLVASGKEILPIPPAHFDVPPSALDQTFESPYAVTSFMCPSPVGLVIYDQEVTIHAVLHDAGGKQVGESSMQLTARCPSSSIDECHQLCSGPG